MNPYTYINGAGRVLPLYERPPEPLDANWPEPDPEPACTCTKCGQGIWPGEYSFGDGLRGVWCPDCFRSILEKEFTLSEIAESMGYDVLLR